MITKSESEVNSLLNYNYGNMGIVEQIHEMEIEEHHLWKERVARKLIIKKTWPDGEIAEMVELPLWQVKKVRLTTKMPDQ